MMYQNCNPELDMPIPDIEPVQPRRDYDDDEEAQPPIIDPEQAMYREQEY